MWIIRMLFSCVALLLLAFPLRAEDTGEQLVRQLFADMKAGNVLAIEAIISPAFQSIHQDGPRDRQQEIALVEHLNMGSLVLGDFVETREGNVLVVTYSVFTDERIAGERLSGNPARRLTVFLQTSEGWRWIAHANLQSM